MKITSIAGITLLLLLVSAVQVAGADDGKQRTELESVYVSSVVMDPEVLFPYEEGTVSITVSNAGNTSIGVSNPDIVSDDIHVTKKDTWQTVSYIVSGSTITYDFIVSAEHPDGDGSYFAMFTIQTVNGATVHYPLTLKIDSDDLLASVSKKPDAFPLSVEKDVNITIVNPRDGAIDNILVTSSGSGIEVSPSQKYVGTLAAQSSIDVPFTITAHEETELTFHISYQTGETDHATTVILPITVGNDKTAAVPTINNIVLTSSGISYDLSGDVSNTGITDANGMIVTVGSPARGTGMYPEYAIGSLASDDSSSFEVTFTCTDLTAVPLVIRWKDASGSDYSFTRIMDLTTYTNAGGMSTPSDGSGTNSSSRTSDSGRSMMQAGMGVPGGMGGPGGSSSSSSVLSSITNPKGGLSSFYPVIAMFVLVIAGVVAYKKRKWIMSKLKKQ
ncbi:MAG TPA: hypothetical protein VLL74_03245 [Methanoregula sp.]|nr:hypothetical protein [Methanoregula sp.]